MRPVAADERDVGLLAHDVEVVTANQVENADNLIECVHLVGAELPASGERP